MRNSKKEEILTTLLKRGIQVTPKALSYMLGKKQPTLFLRDFLDSSSEIPQFLTEETLISSEQRYPSVKAAQKELIDQKTKRKNLGELDWDFTDADTQFMTHGLHVYPARMIPQIARRLIENYLPKDKPSSRCLVLDPFCGSGTVLVESRLLGVNSIGVDTNPLACLLAQVKSSPVDLESLNETAKEVLRKVEDDILRARKGELKVTPFYFKNIFHWFKKDVVNELTIIRKCIFDKDILEDDDIRSFFKIVFSSTLRKVSNIRHSDNPYFIRAFSKEELARHNPDVLAMFKERSKDSIKRMKEFVSASHSSVFSRVMQKDSRKLSLKESPDLIVTSPPYGEETHTMSYGRFAKLSLFWLGMTKYAVNRAKTSSLGGVVRYAPKDLTPTLYETINEINKKNSKRAKEVAAFFYDYHKCLQRLHDLLASNRYCCIVIGNRSASGVPIPNGQITVEFGEQVGFEHETTFERNIPKKTLPRHDYKVDLINREEIVILRKE